MKSALTTFREERNWGGVEHGIVFHVGGFCAPHNAPTLWFYGNQFSEGVGLLVHRCWCVLRLRVCCDP